MQLLIAFRELYIWIDERHSSWLLPTLARLIFAATLLIYYWKSAATKLGDGIFGIFSPSVGAYAQIFPKAMEQVGYDPSQLTYFHSLVVFAGTISEFILPFLLLVGLLTRLAALGMIGFVIVQSYVDIVGHGLGERDIGTWFDVWPSSLIFDQRAFWIFLFLVLIVKGPGPISVDRVLTGLPLFGPDYRD